MISVGYLMNKISWPFMLCHQRKIIIRARCCKTYTTDTCTYRSCLSASHFPIASIPHCISVFCVSSFAFSISLVVCVCMQTPPIHRPSMHQLIARSIHPSIHPLTYQPSPSSLHLLIHRPTHLTTRPSSLPSTRFYISLSALSSFCLLLLLVFFSFPASLWNVVFVLFVCLFIYQLFI